MLGRFLPLAAAVAMFLSACAPAAQTAAPTAAPAKPAAQPTAAPAKPAAEKPAAATKELRAVSVATTASGQSGYLAQLIEQEGIAAKYGLKIEHLPMDFTEAANALKLGKAVAATMQPSTAVNLKKSGTEVRLFSPQIWSGNAWVVRKDSPYQSLKDLKGKKIGNFSRATGAYFFSAVMAKEQGLDIEKDFENIQAETGALMAILERGEVEAINMFEPHVTKLIVSGKYRVMTDFDSELQSIFGSPPLKTGMAVTRETAEKDPALVKALRDSYLEGINFIKAGKDDEFFKKRSKELFGLNTPEEVTASIPRNRANFAETWNDDFIRAQIRILQKGIDLELLPKVEIDDLWLK